jgi:predicted nucleic acid-binding protein
MSAAIFLDTNVLIYAALTEPKDNEKKLAARKLLARNDAGLSVQVLQEFYVQTTRPTRHNRLSHVMASGLIEAWTRFDVQPMTLDVLLAALAIKQRHRLSYWDSAIAAAALALGCCELYTEDMQHGLVIEGLRLINPFL